MIIEDNFVNTVTKTKQAVNFLKQFNIYDDVEKVQKSKRVRPGKGKARNGRFTFKKGPLFILGDDSAVFRRAVRNIKGVDVANVNRLNLLHLAPGGQLGRFVVFSKSAFEQLQNVFGSFKGSASLKKGYNL